MLKGFQDVARVFLRDFDFDFPFGINVPQAQDLLVHLHVPACQILLEVEIQDHSPIKGTDQEEAARSIVI